LSMQPLICRAPLLPGESLPSLLACLATINSYEPRSILFSIIRDPGKFRSKDRRRCPSQICQFRRIEVLTNIAPYEQYRATSHYFTPILTPPENEIEYLELAHGLSIPFRVYPDHPALRDWAINGFMLAWREHFLKDQEGEERAQGGL
jgi:hypothetical protein